MRCGANKPGRFPACPPWVLALGVGLTVSVASSAIAASAGPCPRCGWSAPTGGRIRSVSTISELERAIATARPRDTILLADGTYPITRMIDLPVADLTLRGRSGQRSRVVLRGGGMTERRVGVGLSISAQGVTLADLSVGEVGFHGIQVRGETAADRFTAHNVRVFDTGQQLLKGSMTEAGRGPHQGLVACSAFEYTDSAPGNYTNGVDVLGGRGWVVRDNLFQRVRGPRAEGFVCGPSVLFWKGSSDTRVERNGFLDCYRGIALGLTAGEAGRSFDHRGGAILQNVILNTKSWADEAIEANGASGVLIAHNTVFVEGKMPWSISIRFPNSSAVLVNNLTNRPAVTRDGGRITGQRGNIHTAKADWFVDPERANLRLRHAQLPAVNAGVPTDDLPTDFDRTPRTDHAPDAGAFEYLKTQKPSP